MLGPLVEAVDDDGVSLLLGDGEDLPLDVFLDDQRVWSFWVVRDTRPGADERLRRVSWPGPLRPHLDGSTRLRVAEHVSGRVLLEEDRCFRGGSGRVRVVDGADNPLGIDKSGRLTKTFEHRGAEHVGPLLDAVELVLGALRQAGVDAFVAYGTLLGAVRQGTLIGHDSDADLGYVSRHRDPLDVCVESFGLQRRVAELGFATQRYSGASFKVMVAEADGQLRGLDVFGGFLDDSAADPGRQGDATLYLMGEVGTPFREEWVFPLSTAVLEGREVPVPARPEKLLEAMYGPAWKVPDPAFKFTTPVWVQRALTGWFRGTRPHRDAWARRYSGLTWRLPTEPESDLAHAVLAATAPGTRVVEIGAGRGVDALFYARHGRAVTAYDMLPNGALAVAQLAREEGLDLDVQSLNLAEWRSAVATGLHEAHREGPRVLVARHVADSTPAFARDSLWRLASLALRGGGVLHLEDWVGGGTPQHPGHHPLPTSTVVAELTARGAEVVSVEERHEAVTVEKESVVSTEQRTVARVVAQWRA